MVKLIFILFIKLGYITPEVETNDNRQLYTLITPQKTYHHVYKEEIENYILTSKFIYNEDL